MPYKKQKAISSNKKHNKYGLMTDLGIRNTLHWSRDTDKHKAKPVVRIFRIHIQIAGTKLTAGLA